MSIRQLCHIGIAASILSFANLAGAENAVSGADPYQTYNRHAFALNQTVDKVVYKPVATIYKTITPDIAQRGIQNAFGNLATVPVIANDFLQLKIYQGTSDIWRFLINSTVGVLGLFDVASHIGLPAHQNDFGMTLANWGFHQSHYFVIPFLGPSTVRDTLGYGVDLTTFSAYSYMQNVRLRNSLLGLNFVQQRAQLLQFNDLMRQAAVDPYVFQRNAFLQHRDYVVSQNLGESTGKSSYVAEDTYVPEDEGSK